MRCAGKIEGKVSVVVSNVYALSGLPQTFYAFDFDVCVTVHHSYNNINSQLDATIIVLLIISINSACSGR